MTTLDLVKPLHLLARQKLGANTPYVLSVIDWSKLDYKKHSNKRDTNQISNDWQQESGLAILKRLLVASMASATVWALQGQTSDEAMLLKSTLARLSGKSRKSGRPPTAGVLLSGLFVLLRILDFCRK